MLKVVLAHAADLAGFRDGAKRLLLADTPPEEALWTVADADPDLLADLDPPVAAAAVETSGEVRVPRRFAELVGIVICHSDSGRFDLLYRLLRRVVGGDRQLLDRLADPEVARALAMAKAIRYEEHKMHAFVRFREVATEDGSWFVAWHEPAHHIVDLTAPFFVDRFGSMCWSILTPTRSAHWDRQALRFSGGVSRDAAPAGDALEEHWRTYYKSIFNPARLNPRLMRQHMPERFWKNMPEAEAIGPLMAEANARTRAMIGATPAVVGRKGRVELGLHDDHAPREAPERSRPADLAEARDLASRCRACPLWQPATQTVFGEGPQDAPIMVVGEQPGDMEDLAGRPFVGPAGQLFDRALAQAGIERGQIYVTNAVKHFKYEPRGKRRIHSKPDAGEIEVCRWWVDLEREFIRPRLLVAMGATACRSLLGRDVAITRERGRLQRLTDATELLITVHPSFVLRIPDRARQDEEFTRLVGDLRLFHPFLKPTAGERAAVTG